MHVRYGERVELELGAGWIGREMPVGFLIK